MSRDVRSTRTLKRILLSFLVLGLASTFSVGGTFAILKSEETNAGSTVATGTFTFSNTVGAGTACTSNTGSSNVNTSCSTLYASPSLLYPGDSQSSTVTITNTGSIPIGAVSVYMPSCTYQASPGAGTNAGGGNPCSNGVTHGPILQIEEDTSGGTAIHCWWPDQAAGACSPSHTQANWFGIVATYKTSVNASPISAGSGPAAGQSRYFKVTVSLPANTDATLQGEEALFTLTWHVTT